jgi:hypothetical protein
VGATVFGLVEGGIAAICSRMSTVAEIESAIQKLPTEQMLAVAAWLDEHRAMIQASEGVFVALDAEEGEMAGKQWLGD